MVCFVRAGLGPASSWKSGCFVHARSADARTNRATQKPRWRKVGMRALCTLFVGSIEYSEGTTELRNQRRRPTVRRRLVRLRYGAFLTYLVDKRVNEQGDSKRRRNVWRSFCNWKRAKYEKGLGTEKNGLLLAERGALVVGLDWCTEAEADAEVGCSGATTGSCRHWPRLTGNWAAHEVEPANTLLDDHDDAAGECSTSTRARHGDAGNWGGISIFHSLSSLPSHLSFVPPAPTQQHPSLLFSSTTYTHRD